MSVKAIWIWYVVCLGIVVTPAPGQQFYNLGTGFSPMRPSADGAVVTGIHDSTAQYFFWTPSAGVVVDIGGQVPGNGYGGQPTISDDGTRIAGSYINPVNGKSEMSYYTIATSTWTPLGGIGGEDAGGIVISSGYAISGNGLSVVGLGYIPTTRAHAIQWTEGGSVVDLGSTVVNRSSRANGVDFDGTTVVGWQDQATGFRQAAVWVNGVQTVLWADVAQTLPVSEAFDVTADGTWTVGGGSSLNNWEAWRWNAGPVQNLGHLQPTWRGRPLGVSADGSVIIGYETSIPPDAPAFIGFAWTQAGGMVNMNTYVDGFGVNRMGIDLIFPTGISADGRTIVGVGTQASQIVGWVVQLPCECPADMNKDGNKDGLDVQEFSDCLFSGGVCSCADVDAINGVTLDDAPAFVDELLNDPICP